MAHSPFRQLIRFLHQRLDFFLATLFSHTSPLGKEHTGSEMRSPISREQFERFSFAKHSHFSTWYIPHLYRQQFRTFCDLKVYQDLFMYNFLIGSFPPGAKLLEIGGGDSRVIQLLKSRYEFWNIDKFEGKGHGPTSLPEIDGFHIVQDYIGNFNPTLPSDYFDGIFSISTLEHVPESDAVFHNIVSDINRLLKPGGISVHCIDMVLKEQDFWPKAFIQYFYSQNIPTNPFIPFADIRGNPDLWTLSPYAYYSHWFARTKRLYREFGRPTSYQIIWTKG